MTKEAIKLAIDWIESQPEETTASKYDVNSRYAVLKELEAALTQEQGEPVGWMDSKGNMICTKINESCKPLYTTPQQRTWVGLTDEERLKLYRKFEDCLESDGWEYEKAIEAKLKEKNR